MSCNLIAKKRANIYNLGQYSTAGQRFPVDSAGDYTSIMIPTSCYWLDPQWVEGVG